MAAAVLVAGAAAVTWALLPGERGTPPADRTLLVCAKHLTVRRDPLTETRTKVLATLAPGDRFVVEGSKGQGWVYGHSTGSATVTGWALHQWLRPTCS